QERIRVVPLSSEVTWFRFGRSGRPRLPVLSAYPWYGWLTDRMIRSRSRSGSTAAAGPDSPLTIAGRATSTTATAATRDHRRHLSRRTTADEAITTLYAAPSVTGVSRRAAGRPRRRPRGPHRRAAG